MNTIKVICPDCKDKDQLDQVIMLGKGHNENFIRVIYWCQNCNSIHSEEWELRKEDWLKEFLRVRSLASFHKGD